MLEHYGSPLKSLSLNAVAAMIFFFPQLGAASPASLTYQGRILNTDGTPLQHNNVSFLFQITDPSGACVVYEEQVNGYNMNNSGGVFDVPIGLGTRSWPASGSFTILDSMNNSSPRSCFGGSTYNPALDDIRKLRVQFYDGAGWKLISPDNVIRSVPYAGYAASAARLGTNVANDFLLKAGLPTCGAGTFLSWNGTTLSCAPVAGASGGTVTDVTSANGYITIINGTSTPQLTLQVGTAAGTVAAGDDTRFTNARVPSGSAGGDLSGSYPTPSVARMQGVSISAAAPTSGDFLKYNGTNWQGAAIAIGDVTNLSTSLNAKVNVSQFPASCAADQALTFSSPTGTFICASIAIAGSQVTGNIAGNAAGFTGALVGDVSGTQGVTSVDKIKGVPVVMTGNGSGKVLTFNGTSWAPADPATSGTVTAVSSTNSYLSVSGTTTPALTLNVGAIANTVAAGNDTRIVNAIQNAGATVSIQSGLEAALPASSLDGKIYIATDSQKIYRDNGTAWVVIATASGGGGTVTSVGSGTGLTGGPITGSGTLAVDVGVTNGKILQLDGSARIPAVDGSLVTNLNPVNLSVVVPVNKGGTGQSSYTDGQILVGNSTGNTLAKQNLTGDASMTNAGVVTVNGVKGISVSAAPTLTGQMLRYDGTNWTPNFVSMFDLRSTLTGAQAFGGVGCTAGQTLTWTAATDNLACTTISITTSQIASGTLPIANGGTGAATTSQAFVFAGPATGGAGAPAFRALASTDLPTSVTNGLWTESSGNVYRSSGNVGIGTTSPTYQIDVVGAGRFSKTGLQAVFRDQETYLQVGAVYTDDTNGRIDIQGWDNVGVTGPRAISLQPVDGNVGIGTTSPTEKLDVAGHARVSGSVINGGMDFVLGNGDQVSRGNSGLSRALVKDAGTTLVVNYNGDFSGGTRFDGASGSPNFFVSGAANGNVGIGTTTPATKLHVHGATGLGALATLSNTDVTGITYMNFIGTGAAYGVGVGNDSEVGLGVANKFLIYDHATGPRVVIDSSGNVGIGTTAPVTSLDISGSGISSRIAPSASGTTHLNMFSGAAISTRRFNVGLDDLESGSNVGSDFTIWRYDDAGAVVDQAFRIQRSTGNVGIGTTSPSYTLHVNGSVAGTSAYNNLSDGRLKKNVVEVDDALEKIMKLRGVTFDWRKDVHPDLKLGDRQELGVIAQEVEAVFPQAVSEDVNTGIKSVAYSMLISPIIQSLKEIRSWLMKQDRSIASVNERVDAYESRETNKDKEIKELNARLQKQNERLTEQIQKQAKELEAIKKKLNL